MRKVFLLSLLALGACSAVPTTTAGDATGCAIALVSAGTSSPTALLAVAAATPACANLAADALQAVIRDVSARQAARGLR